jgi:ankyrin repeat protein
VMLTDKVCFMRIHAIPFHDFNAGLSAFHWALILGHIDIISIMTFLNQNLLHICDERGRSPLHICTHVRPKMQVYCERVIG